MARAVQFVGALGCLVAAFTALGCTLDDKGTAGMMVSDSGTAGSSGHPSDASVDTSQDHDSPDVCSGTHKVCSGQCVTVDDPAYGCTATGCTACQDLDHAEEGCAAQSCGIKKCEDGWGDCNNDPSDGCEAPLNTTTNCGQCGSPCSFQNAQGDCSTRTCVMGSCLDGFKDCDTSPLTGCETDIRTIENCGGCNTPCVVDAGVASCATGTCEGNECPDPNTANCDPSTNDCETRINTTDNCNGCGVTCSRNNATATCETRECRIASCQGSFENCDNVDSNGCEANLNDSADHCGDCDHRCSSYHTVGRSCDRRTCAPQCENGWGDCIHPAVGQDDDGCETPLNTATNCGGCGTPCAIPNAVTSCASVSCQFVECEQGWLDCNTDLSDGCETHGSCNQPDAGIGGGGRRK